MDYKINQYTDSQLAAMPKELRDTIIFTRGEMGEYDADIADLWEEADNVLNEKAKEYATAAPAASAKKKPCVKCKAKAKTMRKGRSKKAAAKPKESGKGSKPTEVGKYSGVFGDFDGDGVLNVDDPRPTVAGDKDTVEEVKLSDEISALINFRNDQDSIRIKFVKLLEDKAQGEDAIYSRTKTPFSIINKLRRKRLSSQKVGVQGITDIIGTMVVFDTHAELEKFKAQVDAGVFGKVLEFDDYYKNPQAGYKAYHWNVIYDGTPVEIQAKSVRMKKIAGANHTYYKTEGQDASMLLALTDIAEAADKGDTRAAEMIDAIIADPAKMKHHLLTEKAEYILEHGKMPRRPQTVRYNYEGEKMEVRHVGGGSKKFHPWNPIKDMKFANEKFDTAQEVIDFIAQNKMVLVNYPESLGNHTAHKAALKPTTPHASKEWMQKELAKAKAGDFKNYSMKEVLEAAQQFERHRKAYGKGRDEASDSKKRLSPTPENLVRWMNNPGGFDMIGVDTYSKSDPTANLRIKKEAWWNRIGIKL